MNNPYSIAFRHNLRVQRIRHLRARGLNNVSFFETTLGENADSTVEQTPIEKAILEVARLNARINSDAEARRQFVEATK